MASPTLGDGDLLPQIHVPPPGPRARQNSRRLEAVEAPGINTLGFGPTLQWAEARGANVLDVDGNIYVDLTAGFGVAAIGHRHPRVVAAVRAQSKRLMHGLGDVHAHPARIELAERLAASLPVAPDPQKGKRDSRIHFAISGADAVEIALKTALLHSQRSGGRQGDTPVVRPPVRPPVRPGVLVFDPAYHGMTLGALAATSRPEFRQPFRPWLHPCVERLPFGVDIDVIEARLEANGPGPDNAGSAGAAIGCVLVEPLVGREGILIPPAGWLTALAAACRRHDVVLIADEIFTGFGRTGSRFAVDAENVEPDLLCCGKALGGGLPIGVVAGRRQLMDAWSTPGEAMHTATFVAHPLACAAALASLDVLRKEHLVDRARTLGKRIDDRIAAWPERFQAVREVRGRGLMWGIEFKAAEDASRVTRTALQAGVLLLAGGPEGRVAELTPPLTIREAQLDAALDVLQSALEQL